MMRRAPILLALILTVATQTACADSLIKDITEPTRRAAAGKRACIDLGIPELPFRAQTQPVFGHLEALQAAELLTSRKGAPWAFGMLFTPTEAGEAVFEKISLSTHSVGGMQFEQSTVIACYAHPEFVRITKYTEPAPQDGVIVTTVTFEQTLSDFASWAELPGVLDTFDQIKRDFEQKDTPHEATVKLKKTSSGWEPF